MSESERPPRPIVTAADFGSVDIQKIAQETSSASSHVIMRAYEVAFKALGEAKDGPEGRALRILAAIFSIGLRPDAQGDIWIPMWTMDGQRSSLPSDFSGEQSDVLGEVISYLIYPPLVARLADIAWTNDRAKGHTGQRAVAAYCACAEGLAAGEYQSEFERDGADTLEAYSALVRATQISAVLTGKKKIDERLRPAFDAVYEAAKVGGHFVALGKLMDFGFSQDFRTAEELATDGEAVATNARPGVYRMAIHGLLRRAARFHERANNDVAKDRCLLAAAEQTLAMRHDVQKDSGAEAHWVDQAIREMVGIPDTEDRRAALEVELRELQLKSLGNMGSFSVDLECKEDQERVTGVFGTLGLSDGLIQFAHLTSSPDPEMLRNEASQQRAYAPLSAILSAAYIDERGRTTKVVSGGDDEDDVSDDRYWRSIEMGENIRRASIVGNVIEPARAVLMARFNITEAHFLPIVSYSPFVPPSQRMTFALGFTRMFQRDYISAAHLLLAQIEGSVRKALLDKGFDASKRRDDGTVEDLSLSNIFRRMPEQMNAVFGPALAHEIRQLFSQRPGPALRHEIAHGKLADSACYNADVIYACWLIYRITCLPLTNVWDKSVGKALEPYG